MSSILYLMSVLFFINVRLTTSALLFKNYSNRSSVYPKKKKKKNYYNSNDNHKKMNICSFRNGIITFVIWLPFVKKNQLFYSNPLICGSAF